MSIRMMFLVAASIGVLATPSVASAQPGRGRIDVPPVPPNLEVPQGHDVYLHGRAIGTQNYVCLSTSAGFRWHFIGPQATLFNVGGDMQQQIATHFLSPNPAENGVARATWQQSHDSSHVWARAIASSTDANYVAPDSIPWLLLQAVGAAVGPTGAALFVPTSYIQRLTTEGGIAPTVGCSQANDIGAMTLVPYATDYFFYRPNRR